MRGMLLNQAQAAFRTPLGTRLGRIGRVRLEDAITSGFGRMATLALTMLIVVAWPLAPVSAQTAEEALVRYKALTSVAPKRCNPNPSPDIIIVCATRLRESQKVPFIEELRMGDRPRLAAGEVARYSDRPPCGPRGAGCYDGPGMGRALSALLDHLRD